MHADEGLRVSDPAVVARYLQLRRHFHDRVLAQVEAHIEARYRVQPTTRVPASVILLVRHGFVRPGEGEVWPAVFLTAVDVSLGLCIQIAPERLAGLGTMVNGPQRLRRRHWEDWYGWEVPVGDVRPHFFELSAAEQEEAMFAWYVEHLEWLAHSGLMQRQ
jgi:hypothetical protein